MKLNINEIAVESRVSDWDMLRFELIVQGHNEPLQDIAWVRSMKEVGALLPSGFIAPEIVKALDFWFCDGQEGF